MAVGWVGGWWVWVGHNQKAALLQLEGAACWPPRCTQALSGFVAGPPCSAVLGSTAHSRLALAPVVSDSTDNLHRLTGFIAAMLVEWVESSRILERLKSAGVRVENSGHKQQANVGG